MSRWYGRQPGSPEECASRWRNVTCVFPCTPKLWKKRVTRSSRPILRSRTQTSSPVVVASGLVSDATSKIVSSRIGDVSPVFQRPAPGGPQEHDAPADVDEHHDARERRRARPPHPSPARRRSKLTRRAPPRTPHRCRSGAACRAPARRFSERWPAGKPAITGNDAPAKKSRKTSAATSPASVAVAVGERSQHDRGDARRASRRDAGA